MELTTVQIRLFPLNIVLFPGMLLPLHIFEDRYKLMISECLAQKTSFGVALIRRGQEVGGPAKVHKVGTVARIEQSQRLDDGRYNLLVVGETRFRIVEVTQETPYMSAHVSMLPQPESEFEAGEKDDLARRLRYEYAAYDRLTGLIDDDWEEQGDAPTDAMELAYHIAATMPMSKRDKQRLLAQDCLNKLLETQRAALSERNFHHRSVLAVRKLIAEREAKYGPLPSPFRLN